VIVFVADRSQRQRREKLRSSQVEVCEVAGGPDGRPLVGEVMRQLGQRQFTNLFVEAGPGIMGSLLDADLIDEVHVFVAPTLVGGTVAAGPIGGRGAARIPEVPRLCHVRTRTIEPDLLIEGDVVHLPASEMESQLI
jgi:diaminohydroxyphosphoribosylaminopyrimidine deaminase/5-amino-6-(5-phosphoribosylamino)uracil reductase